MKEELLLIVDILDIIAACMPHGGSETQPERDLRDKLDRLRRTVMRKDY